MVSETAVWAIFFLPLASMLVIPFLPRSAGKYSGHVAALCIGIAFILACWTLKSVYDVDGHRLAFSSTEWLRVGNVTIDVGLTVDGLSALMLVVVTGVSFLVQIYSQGYMHGDGGYWRYFTYMSLFTTAMIGLVLMSSLVMVYVFWEMVGISSYLLIGFWFDRPAAAAAAKKAFLVTRFADVGFLLAILLIYTKAGTFDIASIHQLAIGGALGSTVLTFFALGVFAGAAGKSAQVPFQVWLPDAMEGPTPVSALIHSATMVAAGVYLVARMFPVFDQSPDAMHVVGAIGGLTAISAALIGLVMTDIKRVLAYSTISQLGYMMLALGSGGYVAAIFHLFTHAFFKPLLFLGSGSVNHTTNTFDMRLMGGLRKSMPITYVTFLIASLSLSGIFPFAGFWSKDEILGVTWQNERYLFWIALITVGLTAFYTFRAVFMTFFGEYHGGAPAEGTATGHGPAEEQPIHAEDLQAAHPEATTAVGAAHDEHAHGLHESPFVMLLPMLVLAVLAIFAGFANINKDITHLLAGALPAGIDFVEPKFHLGIAVASMALALGGIALAYVIYGAQLVPSSALARMFRPAHVLLEKKYYADVFYERLVVGFLFYDVIGGICVAFDRYVIDGVVNGVGRGSRQASSVLRYVQDGQFQTYGAIAFSGLVFTAIVVLVLTPL
ncbi:MAG TPA: NADH-quinone oxidoreductase subunit L [Dehalococcoidia bacterium]|nr:NADH-quinone oxidoreductase subunit L [Dehalococcoidia bacterium]